MMSRMNRMAGSCYALMTGLLLASAATAFGQASLSVYATNVDSNGRVPGHVSGGDYCNGVIGPYTHAGSPFPVGDAVITGSAYSTDPMWWATRVDELRYSIVVYDSGWTKKAQWNASPVKQIHSQFWYHNPVSVTTADATATQDASSLGTIQPGDHFEFRFWEGLDDPVGGNPCNLVDATWSSVNVTVYRRASSPNGTILAELASDGIIAFDTTGSDYDTIICAFDGTTGAVLAINDDGGGVPGGPSAITLDAAALGESVYIAVVGTGGGFDDGFLVTPGDAGGDLVINCGAVTTEGRAHPDGVYWLEALITVPDCPSDLDGDGDVDLTDLATLLAAYGTACP